MLAELMRLKQCVAIAGTHGKTTTTSLVATLLDAAGLDPTVINGGIINAYGTNARRGDGDWMVVEADESDGTFLKLPADVAIVTNIDPEHLDHFKTFDAIKDAFYAFVENLPFYGFAVMCLDHPTVQELVGRIEDRRVITYGENPQADVRLLDVDLTGGVTRFNVLIRDRKTGAGDLYRRISSCRCPAITTRSTPPPRSPSRTNSAAPIATIRRALAGFGGVKRRFTRTGEWNGVDDLRRLRPPSRRDRRRAARRARRDQGPGHRHRAAASLHAAAVAVRRNSRTCFNDADTVIVADVYPAGEAPIEGVDKEALDRRDQRAWPSPRARRCPAPDKLAGLVREFAKPGDYVVCLGAGNITQWAYALPGELAAGAREPTSRELRRLRRDSARPRSARRAAGALHLVPRRRPGRRARLAGRRGRPRLFARRLPREIPVTVDRPRLEPHRPRRRRARRGDPPRRQGVRRDRDGRPIIAWSPAPPRSSRLSPSAAAEAGIDGLAFLRGMPGAIGGALRMNAGAHGGETKDVLVEARGVDRAGRRAHFRPTPTWASPTVTASAPDDVIFTRAVVPGPPRRARGDPRRDGAHHRGARSVAADPREDGRLDLQESAGRESLDADRRAGCRGLRVGDAEVSTMHCNFLINRGAATAADIEALGEEVRRRVRETSGVELEWEIKTDW